MEKAVKSMDDKKDFVIDQIQKIVDENLDLGNFDIDEIRFTPRGRNCRWIRKRYIRNGRVYIKYVRKCD